MPNILFIFSDQHNAKFLSCAAHPHALTPNLDALAAGGVRFTNAVAQNTICTPSRMCYLSGQYCHNHGHYALLGANPGGLPTVYAHFRRAGYHIGYVGKSHAPEYWIEDDCDEFHDTCGTAVAGRSGEYVRCMAARGLDADSDYKVIGVAGQPSALDYEDSEEGWGARKAIDMMSRAHAAGQPFFVTFAPPKPHAPNTPARRFWDLYDPARLTLPPNADYDLQAANKAPHLISVTQWVKDHSADYYADRWTKLRAYLGNVSHVDHAVGQLLTYLDQAGLANDTIVVYGADHGDYACEHGPNEKVPGIAADAVTHIPMIWRWPARFKPGHLVHTVAETVDVAPTLCALAGLEPLQTADGRDLSAALAGGPGDPNHPGLTEYPLSKSFRKGPWRLVRYVDGFFTSSGGPARFGELYNLDADPWEMKNLYFDPAHAAIVAGLERELFDRILLTTRPCTIQSPVTLTGPQARVRYTWPVNADGKVPHQQFGQGLGGPHL